MLCLLCFVCEGTGAGRTKNTIHIGPCKRMFTDSFAENVVVQADRKKETAQTFNRSCCDKPAKRETGEVVTIEARHRREKFGGSK